MQLTNECPFCHRKAKHLGVDHGVTRMTCNNHLCHDGMRGWRAVVPSVTSQIYAKAADVFDGQTYAVDTSEPAVTINLLRAADRTDRSWALLAEGSHVNQRSTADHADQIRRHRERQPSTPYNVPNNQDHDAKCSACGFRFGLHSASNYACPNRGSYPVEHIVGQFFAPKEPEQPGRDLPPVIGNLETLTGQPLFDLGMRHSVGLRDDIERTGQYRKRIREHVEYWLLDEPRSTMNECCLGTTGRAHYRRDETGRWRLRAEGDSAWEDETALRHASDVVMDKVANVKQLVCDGENWHEFSAKLIVPELPYYGHEYIKAVDEKGDAVALFGVKDTGDGNRSLVWTPVGAPTRSIHVGKAKTVYLYRDDDNCWAAK